MNLLRPSLLFWVCVLALLGAATAGAQTQPLEASFEVTPAAPAANAPVTFTDTTKNPTGATLEYAWDLDADDSYDDGTTATVTKTFPKGQHRVALRVKRIGTTTQTDSVSRTITVGDALPPVETATATPTRHGRPPPPRRRPSSRPRASTSRRRPSSPSSAVLKAPARSASAGSYASASRRPSTRASPATPRARSSATSGTSTATTSTSTTPAPTPSSPRRSSTTGARTCACASPTKTARPTSPRWR